LLTSNRRPPRTTTQPTPTNGILGQWSRGVVGVSGDDGCESVGRWDWVDMVDHDHVDGPLARDETESELFTNRREERPEVLLSGAGGCRIRRPLQNEIEPLLESGGVLDRSAQL